VREGEAESIGVERASQRAAAGPDALEADAEGEQVHGGEEPAGDHGVDGGWLNEATPLGERGSLVTDS
jgi:hypothetical protein